MHNGRTGNWNIYFINRWCFNFSAVHVDNVFNHLYRRDNLDCQETLDKDGITTKINGGRERPTTMVAVAQLLHSYRFRILTRTISFVNNFVDNFATGLKFYFQIPKIN